MHMFKSCICVLRALHLLHKNQKDKQHYYNFPSAINMFTGLFSHTDAHLGLFEMFLFLVLLWPKYLHPELSYLLILILCEN